MLDSYAKNKVQLLHYLYLYFFFFFLIVIINNNNKCSNKLSFISTVCRCHRSRLGLDKEQGMIHLEIGVSDGREFYYHANSARGKC